MARPAAVIRTDLVPGQGDLPAFFDSNGRVLEWERKDFPSGNEGTYYYKAYRIEVMRQDQKDLLAPTDPAIARRTNIAKLQKRLAALMAEEAAAASGTNN